MTRSKPTLEIIYQEFAKGNLRPPKIFTSNFLVHLKQPLEPCQHCLAKNVEEFAKGYLRTAIKKGLISLEIGPFFMAEDVVMKSRDGVRQMTQKNS